MTASILMRPEEYKEVFSWAHKNWENYLEFIRLDPIYRVNYANGSRYDFSSNLVKLIHTLKSISKSDSVGISPFNGPNIYTIVPTISELYGLWHLKSGMYAYIKALEKLIYELGGIIETETNIEEILISDGIATGIKTSNGTEKGDIIICNADFPYAVSQKIPLITDFYGFTRKFS